MGGGSSSSSSNAPQTTTTQAATGTAGSVYEGATINVTDAGTTKEALDQNTAVLADALNFANAAGTAAADLVTKAIGLADAASPTAAANSTTNAATAAALASQPSNLPATIANTNSALSGVWPYVIGALIVYFLEKKVIK